MRARTLLLPLAALACVALAGADWARFRGPNGTGVSDDKDIPVKWSSRDVVFKVALPGTGHSSPIVSNGRVFLQSATREERLLICLDAVTGKQLWARAAPGRAGKTHKKSSLASATPCSDGRRVCCVFWDGRGVSLYAYDFAGKLLWQRDLGAFSSQHGPGFSPVLVDGKVIVNNDQDGVATLQAFDATTGQPAWTVKRPAFRACYSTPFRFAQGAKGAELLVVSTAGVTGYEPATGKEMWNFTWTHPVKPLRTVGSSVAADGLVYICAGDGDGSRGMIAVKLGGSGDVSKSHLAWSKDVGSTPYVPSVLFRDGHLYAINDFGTALCYEAKTGKEVWRGRVGGNTSASPVLIDGKVYSIDERGDVYVFAATPKGLNLLARNALGESVQATPAVANGRLYVRGARHLYCIGKRSEP